MSICAVYFMGSLVALTLAMVFFIQGVRIQRQNEDAEWERRIRSIKE